MDFGFDESQTAVRALAEKVFERVGQASASEVWRELGRAQLLGVALPADVGGSEAGLVALCLVLEQAGRAANLAPLIPGLVLGALPLAASAGSRSLLASLCAGESLVCGALGGSVHVRREGPGYVLSGGESCVEALPLADAVVVAACTHSGERGLFLLPTRTAGVGVQVQSVASGCALGALELTDVRLDANAVLCELGQADALIAHTLELAYLAQCAYELGLCQGALALTARYASERKQFGRPIGTFQAVGQRIADAYIAVETVRLSLWRAAWLADSGADACQEIAVARSIATRAGHEVVCAAQHIHGGVGFDRSYPLHRYFLASKQNELRLGGHGFHLARLGQLIAR